MKASSIITDLIGNPENPEHTGPNHPLNLDPRIPGSCRFVYLWMVFRAAEKGYLYYSHKAMAEGMAMSVSAVKRAIEKLKAAGWLEVQNRTDDSNLYFPLAECKDPYPVQKRSDSSPEADYPQSESGPIVVRKRTSSSPEADSPQSESGLQNRKIKQEIETGKIKQEIDFNTQAAGKVLPPVEEHLDEDEGEDEDLTFFAERLKARFKV